LIYIEKLPLLAKNLDFDFFSKYLQGFLNNLFLAVKFGLFLTTILKVLFIFKSSNSTEKLCLTYPPSLKESEG
jgi:hypothetical protein